MNYILNTIELSPNAFYPKNIYKNVGFPIGKVS